MRKLDFQSPIYNFHTDFKSEALYLLFFLFLCINQGLIDAHEQFKATLGEAEGEYQTIVGLVTEVQRLGQQFGITPPDNPYTTLHAQVSYYSFLCNIFSLVVVFFHPFLGKFREGKKIMF